MKVAFLILAHNKPNQVKRLLNLLDSDIFVHIDKKSNIEQFLVDKPNIKYIDDRINIKWGQFTMVEATLNLIRAATEYNYYDKLVLLSGDDYPIKSTLDFYNYLEKNKNINFIHTVHIESEWKEAKGRYEKIWLNNKFYNKFIRGIEKVFNIKFKRKIPDNIEFYGGSQWWCLNQDVAKYIINYVDKNNDLVKFMKKMLIPDEHFFQTIIMNSHYRNTVQNNNLRYIKFEGIHPKTLTKYDKDILLNAENLFFARKFDYTKDEEILNILDNNIMKV